MPKLVKEVIADLELDLALKKAVFNKFPDATVTRGVYSSKLVNRYYNKFAFESNSYSLSVRLRSELDVEYNNRTYIVDVLGTANQSYRLAHLGSTNPKSPFQYDCIQFANFIKEFKKHKVRDDILNECRVEILEYIRKNPKYKIDETNLEPRLKKLLVFN